MSKKVHVLVVPKKIVLYLVICFALILVLVFFNRFRGNVTVWKYSHQRKTEQKISMAAIIIDDFGNPKGGSEEMLNLQIPITCAIMPFLATTEEFAILSYNRGHEVIIHMPMEPHKGNPKWLGERGITTNLSTEEVKEIIRDAVESVPYAVGLNNHMGSKVTEDRRIMGAIINVLKEKNMYIVDSKTSINSVVKEVAEEYGVPVLERSIFLDNNKSVSQIKKQLNQLAKIAQENNKAVAIGHVGPEGGLVTVKAIMEMRSEIEEMGVRFVKVSQLLIDSPN